MAWYLLSTGTTLLLLLPFTHISEVLHPWQLQLVNCSTTSNPLSTLCLLYVLLNAIVSVVCADIFRVKSFVTYHKLCAAL
jgi:hypothetical protein